MAMKFSFKKILALLMIIILSVTIIGCSTKQQPLQQEEAENNETKVVDKTKIRVAALKGPTGMGMVDLMQKSENQQTALDYEFILLGSPDDLVGRIINGEVDVAAVPTNLALILYNRTDGAIQLAGVNTLGVLYLLENGKNINSIEDLRGKSIYISGKGSVPDFVLQYILKENGLVVDKDVILNYKLQHAELAAALASADVDIALLPQPHVASAMMQNENLRIALDITEEWNKVVTKESKLPMGAIIVQKAFLENNKEAMTTFLEEYRESVHFVNNQIDKAAELIEKYDILPRAAIAKKAIPYSNIVLIEAEEAKSDLEDFYQVLFDFDPKSIGGRLPDEGFYYKK